MHDTLYSLTYISEAELSASTNQLFAQKWGSLYPPRPEARASTTIQNPPVAVQSTFLHRSVTFPRYCYSQLDSNMQTHYNVCEKLSYFAG